MTYSKRLFDLVLAFLLIFLLFPLIFMILVLVAVFDGFPIFYLSKRMRTPLQDFDLIKFRTMRISKTNLGVTGGDKSGRITKFGRFLRRTRLDEVPQLWNVIRGDISFVGPRAPLPQYVERFPDLYSKVLKSVPGITGLATVTIHSREERLLSKAENAHETDVIYTSRCIPIKERLDLIYQNNQNLCFDLVLIFRTVLVALFKRS